jgi:hypothetical protein
VPPIKAKGDVLQNLKTVFKTPLIGLVFVSNCVSEELIGKSLLKKERRAVSNPPLSKF